MWKKSLSTRIFFAFTLLGLIQVILMAFLFSRLFKRETETYLFEALSNRVQLESLQILRGLQRGGEIDQLLAQLRIDLVQADGSFVKKDSATHHEEAAFVAETIAALLPSKGTIVTPCQDKNGLNYYCAFSSVPELQAWIFDFTPQSSGSKLFWRLFKEIASYAMFLIGIALLVTFVISRHLLNPVRRFTRAARQVAEGNYDGVELPVARSDEIGELASSFRKMIVDLKDRERSLASSAIKLAHSARLASIGQMGAGIAHEVKNPLTSMMGYARILATKAAEPDIAESAQIILRESERCNQILQQMLRFTRNDPQESKPYSAREVIDSTLLLAKAEADAKKVKLKTDIRSSSAVALGSAQQVQQVLLNLVLNAVQASDSGKEVIIHLSEEEEGFVRIEVEDFGKGIPPALQEKIFDPFFTTKAKGEGTGLGLSVASEIVSGQKGSLAFESHEGRGTKFLVRLPAA